MDNIFHRLKTKFRGKGKGSSQPAKEQREESNKGKGSSQPAKEQREESKAEDQDEDEIHSAECENTTTVAFIVPVQVSPSHLVLMLHLLVAASVIRFLLCAFILLTMPDEPTPDDHIRSLATSYFLFISIVAACYYLSQHSTDDSTDEHFVYVASVCETLSWMGLFVVTIVHCYESFVEGLQGST